VQKNLPEPDPGSGDMRTIEIVRGRLSAPTENMHSDGRTIRRDAS
jgi:hypothetical protein